MPRAKYMTRMQRLYPGDSALSGEVDIDHCRTAQKKQYERPVRFLCSSDDSILKQTFNLLERTSAPSRIVDLYAKRSERPVSANFVEPLLSSPEI